MVTDVGNITTVDDASFHGMDTLACSLHCLWSSAITLWCTIGTCRRYVCTYWALLQNKCLKIPESNPHTGYYTDAV